MVAAPCSLIDDFDRDCAFRTCAHARWSEASVQPAVTHVALADYSSLRIELRDSVGAVPDAVLASDTDFRIVIHDSRPEILRVRFHRTTDQTSRLQAVIAAHRESPLLHIRVHAAFDLANPAPVDVRGIPILLVAGDHSAFAADTLPHVEIEP